MKTPQEIGRLVQMACIWEVYAGKPGNVSRDYDFSDTSLIDFLLSAVIVGPVFEQAASLSVGEIVKQAVAETHRYVRSNTNLGIVLLLAPLAKACSEASGMETVHTNLRACLHNLSLEDARHVYAAIRLASPGGLGKVAESDVSENPSVTLLQAMVLAQDRDSVAREYATDFAITFEIGLPALKSAISEGAEFSRAIVQTYLTILSLVPDTLISRKKGMEAARQISMMAADVLRLGGVFTSEGQTALTEMNRSLCDSEHALNPGTTADLTAAAIFLLLFDTGISI